jgi:hypothetical protein
VIVTLDGDLSRHPAHRVDAAPVTRLDEQLGIAFQKVRVHRHERSVRQDEVGVARELLDEAEDVIPSSAVEPRRMIAEFVQDLVHLESGKDRLDEDSRADRAVRNPELILREIKDLVPEARLQMALHLRKIKIRAGSALDQLFRVVEEIEPEIENGGRHRLSVDFHVLFLEVPSTRTHHECRSLAVEPVFLTFGRTELDLLSNGIVEVDLAFESSRPGRRMGILEVRHEDVRARVQRVDDHLAIDWPGDLDTAVLKILGNWRYDPGTVAKVLSLLEEIGKLAGVDALLALFSLLQKLEPRRVESPVELHQKRLCLGGKDFARAPAYRATDSDRSILIIPLVIHAFARV